MVIEMGSTTVQPPKCAACQLGKQQQTPKNGSKTIKSPSNGNIKQNKIQPGDLVFYDQYESPLEGHQFSTRGNDVSTQKYCSGTLFCDYASGKILVVHQVGLTGTKTVQEKLQFKREATAVGIHVKEYRTDNGIYTLK